MAKRYQFDQRLVTLRLFIRSVWWFTREAEIQKKCCWVCCRQVLDKDG